MPTLTVNLSALTKCRVKYKIVHGDNRAEGLKSRGHCPVSNQHILLLPDTHPHLSALAFWTMCWTMTLRRALFHPPKVHR